MLDNAVTRCAAALAVAVLLVLVGYAWGSSVAKAEIAAEQASKSTEIAVEVLQEAKNNASDAMKVEARAVQNTETNARRATAIAVAVREHTKEVRQKESPNEQVPRNVLDGCFVDSVTVGLLNEARSDPRGQQGDTAGPSHEEVPAAQEAGQDQVDGQELIDADLETARAYWDLAIRHDELVDWVDSKCSPSPQ